MDLLRFTTAGSVDDGKSTLIGRLLFESQAVFEDQLASIQKTAERQQKSEADLAHLVDGLAAEREQGITIDVAYRYFSTNKRRFIIADTPGHEQYTRNMVTGASTADLALLLVDARQGLVSQTKRHFCIAHRLGIPHILLCVNKMDLVDYKQEVFEEIKQSFLEFTKVYSEREIQFIPISALKGEGVTFHSKKMPWFKGSSLLEALESASPQGADVSLSNDCIFPVQQVFRPDAGFRGYAGTVASGCLRPGDAVTVLPSKQTSSVREIVTFDGTLEEAHEGQAVVVCLADEIDVSRGDLLVTSSTPLEMTKTLCAHLSWMSETPLDPKKKYLLKQGPLETKAMVQKVESRLDIETLQPQDAGELGLNDLGLVSLKTMAPVLQADYDKYRSLGRFILIDEMSHNTVAAGMITTQTQALIPQKQSRILVWSSWKSLVFKLSTGTRVTLL